MNIFVADLYENGTGISKQIAGYNQTVAQVSEIAMDSVTPGVTESFDLLWLSGDIRSPLHAPPKRTGSCEAIRRES